MKKGNLLFLKFVGVVSIAFFLLAIVPLSSFQVAVAADDATALWGDQAVASTASGASLASKTLKIFSAIVVVIVIAASIYAVVLWVTSDDNEEQIERAQNILKISAVVLVVLVFLYLIINFFIGRSRSGTPPGYSASSTPIDEISTDQSLLIGNCAMQSVFPELGQKGVQRNMPIMISFNGDANPATICDVNDGAKICNGNKLLTKNIRIFNLKDRAVCENSGSECPSLVRDARVYSRDNRNFTIVPNQFFGSDQENVKMAVRLSGAIERVNADTTRQGMFSACPLDYFTWQFEMSKSIDLVPPSVKKNGVYPVPDAYLDEEIAISAQAVSKKLILADKLKIKANKPAKLKKITAGPKAPEIIVEMDKHNSYDGKLRLVVKNGNQFQLELLSAKESKIRTARLSNATVDFPGYLMIKTIDAVVPGNFWDLEVAAEVKADAITVNERVYSFAENVSAANQILYSEDRKELIANISETLDAAEGFNSWVDGAEIFVVAENKDAAIPLVIYSSTPSIKVASPREGVVTRKGTHIRDRIDKPRNIVIQISFTEPMNPFALSGSAQELAEFIRVKCLDGEACDVREAGFFKCGDSVCVDGEFQISNQATVVEFVSNTQCGVNACNEPIYCLPAESRLAVELRPAQLADCGSDNCVSKGIYNVCGDKKHCQDRLGRPYPGTNVSKTVSLNGLTDAAFNSLDGDRDGSADGPSEIYNENSGLGAGDIFSWSFFIGKKMTIRPPMINSIFPSSSTTMAMSEKSIFVNFDSLMLSSSLRSGQIVSASDTKLSYDLVSLESINNSIVGYWIMNYNINYNRYGNNDSSYTKMEIKHLPFKDRIKYFVSVGTGVKDIYQNCFKPSSSKYCFGDPSCCNNKASNELGCESLKK